AFPLFCIDKLRYGIDAGSRQIGAEFTGFTAIASAPQDLRICNQFTTGRGLVTEKGQLLLVPSKGLEPPHRCRYMDLNHARLPIPPRWQVDLQSSGGHQEPPYQEDLPSYSTGA